MANKLQNKHRIPKTRWQERFHDHVIRDYKNAGALPHILIRI